MLHAYMDESGTHAGSAACVVAGFMGTKRQWESCLEEWSSVLIKYGRESLHMNRLRFTAQTEEEMLAELGPIPHRHKLKIVGSFVYRDDHERIVVPARVMPDHSSMYMVAFQRCVFEAINHAHAQREKISFAFEHTNEYQRPIAEMNEVVASVPNVVGITTLRKDESAAFQVADCLAYQLYQYITNRESVQATWGVSIMGHGAGIGAQADEVYLRTMVEVFKNAGGSAR